MLRETARAKINLTLRVLGRRADGYHELESLVAFADEGDALFLEPGPDFSLVVEGPEAASLAASGGGGDGNLVARAHAALAARVPRLRAGRMRLVKNLPVASGIGGGSADAAAALRLLASVNGLSSDDPRLMDAAACVGADVPVCLAQRACMMHGIGDRLGPPLAVPSFPALLVNPRVATPTPAVFAALGLARGEKREERAATGGMAEARFSLGEDPAAFAEMLRRERNDLTQPAIVVAPPIAQALAALEAARGALLARMSGSGATCFAFFATPAEAGAAGETVSRAHPEWWVRATTIGA
ncbi:MAG: 4-(cytidine 5'-diphospho)-2-C-methyl-D-erythritol kinase [Salinarimonadaceae bacterium]|nr:MAG: 4-(cytidine 5'-diphospho)-2-C-methyl-D-erythritol kinase [Salinarimonadaceae bacterium]